MRFGRLVVIKRNGSNKKRDALWECRCDCGSVKNVVGTHLTRGLTRSCGCYMRECASRNMFKHGHSSERLYQVWHAMMARCYRPNRKEYSNYGGRGISVCDEWHEYEEFKLWADSSGYDKDSIGRSCTLDRIDVNGNYEPNNCRWVSLKEQHCNRRDSINITICGETANLKEFSRMYGVCYTTIRNRYHKHGADPCILLNPVDYKKWLKEHSYEQRNPRSKRDHGSAV